MGALGWHIMMRLREDAVIAPSANARRTTARIFHRHGREAGLLAFGAADTHLHSVVCCSRETAGEFARRVEITLQYHLDLHTGFAPAHIKKVRDQWHLERAFHYVLDQRRRHGLQTDPVHDASSLPDLLGLRVGFEHVLPRVRERLPRLIWGELEQHLGSASQEERSPPAAPDQLVRDGAELVDAGLSAFAGRVDRMHDVNRAKAAAVQASRQPTRELSRQLNCSPSYIRKLRRRAISPSLLEATRRQLALRRSLTVDQG